MSDKDLMRVVSCIILALVFGLPLACLGQVADQSSPMPGSRVIKTFDFEETRLGNFEATPMFWRKVVGKGFPAYSMGAFDHSVYRSANTSFRLTTDGGSVAYRFTPEPAKRIPIQPNADYYILAFVRSSQLHYARPDLIAWMADDQGNLMLDTEMHSQPYRGQALADDAWQVLYIYMPGPSDSPSTAGEPAKNRSLVLQVGLMQPQQLGGSQNKLGKFALFQQDIKGSVWFDDIVVFQLPRVGIRIHKPEKGTTPTGVFSQSDPVDLDLLVSDLRKEGAATGKLRARLRVTDPDNLIFASEEWQATATPEQAWSKRYTHPAFPAGLYTATLEVFDAQAADDHALIARRQANFLCLPPGSNMPQAPAIEFGIGATKWTDEATWADLPPYLRQTGVGQVQLPAWRRDMSEEALTRRDPPFDALLAILQRQNVHIVGAFSELPATIAAHVSGDDKSSIFALLNANITMWRPFMSFPLTRYTNRIDAWELGSPASPFSGNLPGDTAGQVKNSSTSERAAALFGKTYPEIAGLLSRPHMLIPWNALFDFNPDQFPHAALDLTLPSVIKPAQIPAYMASFAQPGRPLIAHLEGLDPQDGSRTGRLADFAQRVVFARSSGPETILFDVSPNAPDELVLVYRTMIHALGGSTYGGELSIGGAGPGVRAFLFKKPVGSTLVIWNDSAASKDEGIDVPLGPSPVMTDLLGNPRPLVVDAATELTHLMVSATPLVIEQADPRPLQLCSSFSLSSGSLPAGAGSVQTEVVLTNPYTDSLTGTLRLNVPKGWTADPPSFPVSLAAGATLRQGITLRYPFTETAGAKAVSARLVLDPGNPAGLTHVDLNFPVSVSSDQIDMECFSVMQANGDIVIQQVITNTSRDPLDAQAYALVPGFPRQQRYIVGLQPNQTTIKRYTFAASAYVGNDGGAKETRSLVGQLATLGVRQNDGHVLLTKAVPFE